LRIAGKQERIIVNGVQKIMMPGMKVSPELVAMHPDAREKAQIARAQ